MQHIKYREDIDALRGLAVVLVVIYHAFPEILPGGFIGVDVFFVISGYLITSIMLFSINRSDFSLKEFYARRVRRLFPALITVLLFVLGLGWLVLFPEEYQQLGAHVAKSVIFILNFELINEVGYFDVESHYKPLLHLWTLSVEEQYYLLWPLIILLFLKINKHPGYLLGFLFFASLSANLYFSQGYTPETYYHTLTRFWQLAAGSLLAVWLVNKQGSQNYFSGKLTMWGGAILILLSAVFIDSQMIYPGYLAILPVVGAVMIIVANSRLKQYAGLVKLGLISYPLYLWHWVFISFLYIYLGRKPETMALVIAVLLSLIFAYLTYKYIEKLRYQKRVTPYLIAVLVIIGLTGVYVEHKKGLPERNQIKDYVVLLEKLEKPKAKDELCKNYLSDLIKSTPVMGFCRLNIVNGNEKTIALIGDSHAYSFYEGFSELARKNGFNTVLLGQSSCPTLKGFEWGRGEVEDKHCARVNKQIIEFLRNNTNVTKVVMLSRGPVYVNGDIKGYSAEEIKVQSSRTLYKQTFMKYADQFRETISILDEISHVKNIFYILENPEFIFHPKELIPRPYDVFSVSIKVGNVPKDLYLLRMKEYRNAIMQTDSKKLSILDPVDALCKDSSCFMFKGDNPVYFDDDHFSLFGSKYLADYFKNAIFKGEI